MNDLRLVYANYKAICFKIDTNLYFLKVNEDIPHLYDSTGKNLNISNIDYWLNINTKSKHSLNSVIGLAEAFLMGMSISFNYNDLHWLAERTVDIVIKEMISKSWLYEFNLKYWIEAQSEEKLKECLDKIRSNLLLIKNKIGDENLKNDLMRIYHVTLVRNLGLNMICEELISTLGYEIEEPKYPITELNLGLCNAVKDILFKNGIKYKNIDKNIYEIIDAI